MKLVYKSKNIKDPTINLVDDIRETMFWLENTSDDARDYIIKMDGVLFSVLRSMILDDNENIYGIPLGINGYKCYEDNTIEDGVYCIYRKDKKYTTPKEFHDRKIRELAKKIEANEIELTPVKTLDEWFANLPLVYKLDLYNSYSEVITKHRLQTFVSQYLTEEV